MTDEKWVDKEPGRRGSYDWDAITKRLQKKPGRWLLIAEQVPRSLRSAVKRDRIVALRSDQWKYDASTNNTNGNLADVYMTATRKEESK